MKVRNGDIYLLSDGLDGIDKYRWKTREAGCKLN